MRKIKLGDVLDVKRGASLSGEYYSETGEKIRLTLGNFCYPACGFKHNTSKTDIYFTGPIKPEFILKKGDIITPMTEQVRGLLGNTATIPEDDLFIQSGDIGLVIPDEAQIDKRFAYYLVSSPIVKMQLDAGSQQTKIRHTSPDAIKNCIAWIPEDIKAQKRIASILDDINSKIENNNAINTELEAMAKTIYDYWFLQFEFPDENGKPYKSSGGKMVWNEELKREIPEKFKVEDILSMCKVVDCLHSQKPSYLFEDEKYYLLTLENLAKDGTIDLSEKFYISKKDYEEWISRIEVQENDFLVTNAGRAGDICKLPQNVKCAIGRNITAIRPTKIDPYYLRCFFKSNYLREQILGNLDCGAFFMSFNVKSIKKLKILVPSQPEFNNFIEKIKPMVLKIEENVMQNQELASLRDFLLPLLMNGQVTFKGDN